MTASANMPLRGELRMNEPLARYTSWRVGGAARQLYRPMDADDLAEFLADLPVTEPLFWLGLGSNVLIRDGGFPGTVIVTQGRLNDIEVRGTRIHAEAGAACAHVARLAARLGLTGAAFLAGIPGTMGGALAMNAGAFGGETWDKVMSVKTIDRHGQIHQRHPADYAIAYRHVQGPQDEWFLSCELQLSEGDAKTEQAAIRALLDTRAATQPTGQPSGGSTFRNPPGDHAARLIERAGLKGYCIGGAQVSEKHANFVINTGDASAADIERLIAHMQQTVRDAFGIELVREVHILGVPA